LGDRTPPGGGREIIAGKAAYEHKLSMPARPGDVMLTPRDSAVIQLAAASEDGGIAGIANRLISVGVLRRSAPSRSMESISPTVYALSGSSLRRARRRHPQPDERRSRCG
jgi:hypothetical protein